MNANNNNQNVQAEAQVMRAALEQDQRISKTAYTKGGEPNKNQSAQGCIVPKALLNGKNPIALTPAAQLLVQWWDQGDQVLHAVLDQEDMDLLKSKMVASYKEANRIAEKEKRDVSRRLGEKKLTSSKACAACTKPTLKAFTFNVPGGKRIPYCHRKDCVEARDEKAASIGISAPNSPARSSASSASSSVATPVRQAPALSVPATPSRSSGVPVDRLVMAAERATDPTKKQRFLSAIAKRAIELSEDQWLELSVHEDADIANLFERLLNAGGDKGPEGEMDDDELIDYEEFASGNSNVAGVKRKL